MNRVKAVYETQDIGNLRQVIVTQRQPSGHDRLSSDVKPNIEKTRAETGQPPDTFQSFYEANWLNMVQLAVLLTGDTTHAEDATQDAFLAVHRQWQSFGADDSPRGYLRGAVVNQCRIVAKKRRTLWRKAPLLTPTPAEPEPLDVVGPHYDMWKAISALPQRMREVVVLRFYEDCDVQSVADALNISTGTVKSTTAKALKRLSASSHIREQS